MNTRRMLTYLRTLTEIAELDDRLEKKKKQLDSLGEQIADDFTELGISNIVIRGMTLYLRPEFQVSIPAANRPRVIDVLHELGLESFVKEDVVTAQLKAWIREKREAGEPVPEPITALVKVYETIRLAARKAAQKGGAKVKAADESTPTEETSTEGTSKETQEGEPSGKDQDDSYREV